MLHLKPAGRLPTVDAIPRAKTHAKMNKDMKIVSENGGACHVGGSYYLRGTDIEPMPEQRRVQGCFALCRGILAHCCTRKYNGPITCIYECSR